MKAKPTIDIQFDNACVPMRSRMKVLVDEWRIMGQSIIAIVANCNALGIRHSEHLAYAAQRD